MNKLLHSTVSEGTLHKREAEYSGSRLGGEKRVSRGREDCAGCAEARGGERGQRRYGHGGARNAGRARIAGGARIAARAAVSGAARHHSRHHNHCQPFQVIPMVWGQRLRFAYHV